MKKFLVSLLRSAEICSLLVLSCALSSAQATVSDLALSPSPFSGPGVVAPEAATVDILSGFPSEPVPQQTSQNTQQSHGFIVRNLRRGLEDQKQLYLAPFKPKNLKWDALFLTTTGGLLAIDRQASREVTQDHVDISHQVALASLLATSAAAGGTWLYGLKTDNAHAKETGQLELETLANTFLIYTPMQFIAGRERPDEATGKRPLLAARRLQHVLPGRTCDVHLGHGQRPGARVSAAVGEDFGLWRCVVGFGRQVHRPQSLSFRHMGGECIGLPHRRAYLSRTLRSGSQRCLS